MNKNRKTAHLLNIITFDENGNMVLPANLALTAAPTGTDNSLKVPSTAWVRTYVTGQSYLTGNQTVTVSGDASGSGTTAITLTLANSGATAGTYGSSTNIPVLTVDAKGRITSVSNTAVNIVSNLAGLSDVTLTSSATGQLLQYNGTKWVNWTPNYLTGITSSQVTTALGFTPYNATNPSGYLTTATVLNTVLTPYAVGANSAVTASDTIETAIEKLQGQVNARLSSITSANVTTALGYTPYNSSNPAGYLTSLGFSYSTGVTANHVVQRDANGYIYANHINFSTSESENPTINSFFVSNGDGWSRKASIAHVRNQLGNYGSWITASGKADGALKLWAASHPNDYYLVNNWTGTYWRITSNHPSGVQVAYADSAGSAGNATSANNADTVDGFHASVGGSANTIPTRNASGYLIPENWIQLNGHYGLYSGTNNAHFYPNNSTYGSWKSLGERNGWRGIHFGEGTGMTLMMNETEFGFHREAHGWYARFTSGTGYFNISGTSGDTSSIASAVGGGYTWTGTQLFLRNNGGQAVNNSNTAALQAYSSGNNSAFMSFHRGGYYAVNFGLDDDNWMRIGGWSAAANRWQLNTVSGDMVVNGDVTAFSDARVKENVHTIQDALQKVISLRGVSYSRSDQDDKKTKIGVIAQETLPVVPEVVNQDPGGMYNVSYGNFAGLFIEAIKEQQKQIEDLKTIIDALTK